MTVTPRWPFLCLLLNYYLPNKGYLGDGRYQKFSVHPRSEPKSRLASELVEYITESQSQEMTSIFFSLTVYCVLVSSRISSRPPRAGRCRLGEENQLTIRREGQNCGWVAKRKAGEPQGIILKTSASLRKLIQDFFPSFAAHAIR